MSEELKEYGKVRRHVCRVVLPKNEMVRKAPAAIAQQAVLVSKSLWEQTKLVEASDWAKMPGTTEVAEGVGAPVVI